MKKKFIQIGTGGFGAYWCETVLPRISSFAEPVAAVDVSGDALKNAVKFLGLPEKSCYTDVSHALRENEADFVTIVVPPDTHEEVIDAAIAAGLDIVCEKPLGGSMESSVRIYNKVKAANRKISVTMSHRLEIEKQTVEALVKSGSFGKLRYVTSRLTTCRPKTNHNQSENAIASLINNGLIHNLDTVRGVCGCNAKTVYANGWTSALEGYGDGSSALVVLEMENGTRAQLEESFANASALDGWSDEYLRAECDFGTIIADHRRVTVTSGMGYPYAARSEYPLKEQEYWDHALVLRDFVSWLDGGPVPLTSLEDNLQCCALTYATVESAMTGRVVDVQEYLNRHLGQ